MSNYIRGKLQLTVHRVSNLPAAPEKSYVAMKIASTTFKSSTCTEKGVNPKYEHTFQLGIDNQIDEILALSVFTCGFFSDDKIAKWAMTIGQICSGKQNGRKWYQLVHAGDYGKHAGDMEITISFTPQGATAPIGVSLSAVSSPSPSPSAPAASPLATPVSAPVVPLLDSTSYENPSCANTTVDNSNASPPPVTEGIPPSKDVNAEKEGVQSALHTTATPPPTVASSDPHAIAPPSYEHANANYAPPLYTPPPQGTTGTYASPSSSPPPSLHQQQQQPMQYQGYPGGPQPPHNHYQHPHQYIPSNQPLYQPPGGVPYAPYGQAQHQPSYAPFYPSPHQQQQQQAPLYGPYNPYGGPQSFNPLQHQQQPVQYLGPLPPPSQPGHQHGMYFQQQQQQQQQQTQTGVASSSSSRPAALMPNAPGAGYVVYGSSGYSYSNGVTLSQ